MERGRKNAVTGCLCALTCEVLYGLDYVVTKQVVSGVSELSLLGWRFLTALLGLSLLRALGVVRICLRGKNRKPLLWVALFFPVIYFVGETFGIRRVTAAESGIFLSCIPPVSLAFSALLLKKKPTALQVGGILVTLIGVLLTVAAAGLSAGFSLPGYLLLLLAVVSYALYYVAVDRARGYSGIEITYIMLFAGAVVFTALAAAEALGKGNLSGLCLLPVRDPGFLAAVLYQGLGCSVLAFFLSNVAVAKIGVNRTASFVGISTAAAAAAGVLFLHETLTVWQAVGALVILMGVYTANAGHSKQGS
ncbi:MAG: DMT family transporter [Clostridia bacterium]|nr:DMT family transporter [Clostridia bacterium]